MKQHTKHLSFLFPVPASYFNSCVRVIKPFEINVHYTLDYRGVVAIEGFTVTPSMCEWIEGWRELQDELQKAAENNARQFQVRIEYEILHAPRGN